MVCCISTVTYIAAVAFSLFVDLCESKYFVSLGIGQVYTLFCNETTVSLSPESEIFSVAWKKDQHEIYRFTHQKTIMSNKYSHWRFKVKELGKEGEKISKFQLIMTIRGFRSTDAGQMFCLVDGVFDGDPFNKEEWVIHLQEDKNKKPVYIDFDQSQPDPINYRDEYYKPGIGVTYFRIVLLAVLVVTSVLAVIGLYIIIPKDKLRRFLGYKDEEVIFEKGREPDHKVITVDGGGVLLVVDDTFMPRPVEVVDLRKLDPEPKSREPRSSSADPHRRSHKQSRSSSADPHKRSHKQSRSSSADPHRRSHKQSMRSEASSSIGSGAQM